MHNLVLRTFRLRYFQRERLGLQQSHCFEGNGMGITARVFFFFKGAKKIAGHYCEQCELVWLHVASEEFRNQSGKFYIFIFSKALHLPSDS